LLEWCETARSSVGPATTELYARSYQQLQDYWKGAVARGGTGKGTFQGTDRIVAGFIDFVYQEGCERGLSMKARANQAFYGLLYAYPQLQGSMPFSARALKGFERMRPSEERQPLPWGAVGVIAADELRRCTLDGRAAEGLAFAVQVLVGFDCFLRVSELCGLRRGHVVPAGDCGTSVLLGIDRPTKTGRNEGTVVTAKVVESSLQDLFDRAP